jgi:hypothetical protein
MEREQNLWDIEKKNSFIKCQIFHNLLRAENSPPSRKIENKASEKPKISLIGSVCVSANGERGQVRVGSRRPYNTNTIAQANVIHRRY